MDAFDELVGEALTLDDDILTLKAHPFFLDAVKHGSFKEDTSGLTVVVPLNYDRAADDDDKFMDTFSELWARHTFPSAIMLGGRGSGVMDMTSFSGITYSVDDSSFGGCPLDVDFSNVQYQGCFFHGVNVAEMPSLRLKMDSLCSLHINNLSGQLVSLSFEKLGIETLYPPSSFTLMVSFNKEDRTPVGSRYQNVWDERNAGCDIKTPVVHAREELMLWFQVYDRCKGHAIVTRLYPYYLEIQPISTTAQNLEIFDMIPLTGRVNDQLWVRGSGFDEKILRVFIGKEQAIIFHASDELLCCYVPPGSGAHLVTVCNGLVFKKHCHMFTYV